MNEPKELPFWGGEPLLEILEPLKVTGGVRAGVGYTPRDQLQANKAYEVDKGIGLSNSRALEYILQSGIVDVFAIELRRDAVKEFDLLSEDEDIQSEFDRHNRFLGMHDFYQEVIYDRVMSARANNPVHTKRLEIYLRDQAAKDENGNYIPDSEPLWEMDSLLSSDLEPYAQTGGDIDTATPQLNSANKHRYPHLLEVNKAFTVEGYIEGSSSYSFSKELNLASKSYSRHKFAAQISSKARGLTLQPLTKSTTGKVIELIDLHHTKFVREEQELNSVSLGSEAMLLTGRNGSGKSHLMEAAALALITGGSIGHVAVKTASVPELDKLSVIYRPQGGAGGLSAFGQDIMQMSEAVDNLGTKTDSGAQRVLFTDEFVSTTDPTEQNQIYARLIPGLSQRGIRLLMTGHFDPSELVSDGLVLPYHFAKKDGRSRVLQEGVGDADSIEVAKECGMNQSITDRAAEILEGDKFTLGDPRPLPIRIKPSTRSRFGDINPGLAWFGNIVPTDKTRVTKNSERYMGRSHMYFYDHERRDRGSIERSKRASRAINASKTEGINFYLNNNDKNRMFHRDFGVHELLKGSSTNNVEEIKLRQEFFMAVMEYPEATQLIEDANYLWMALRSMSSDAEKMYIKNNENHWVDYGTDPSVLPLYSLVVNAEISHLSNSEAFEQRRGAGVSTVQTKLGLSSMELLYEIGSNELSPDTQELLVEFLDISDRLYKHLNDLINQETVELEGGEIPNIELELEARMLEFMRQLYDKLEYYNSDEWWTHSDEAERFSYHLNAMEDRVFNTCYAREFFERWSSDWSFESMSRPEVISKRDFESLTKVFITGNDERSDFYGPTPRDVMLARIREDISKQQYLDFRLKPAMNEAFSAYQSQIKEAEEDGFSSRATGLADGLEFLTSERKIFDEISDQLDKVGGEIAGSLADYVSNEVKSYLLDQSTGYDYYIRTRNKVNKAHKRLRKSDGYKDITGKRPHFALSGLRKNLKVPITETSTYISSRSFEGEKRHIGPVVDMHYLTSILGKAVSMKGRQYLSELGTSLDIMNMRPENDKDFVRSSFAYKNLGGIDLITGSNMGGKTTFLKLQYQTLRQNSGFGMTATSGAILPQYEKHIYLDRPKQDLAEGQSSFMADVNNWTELHQQLEGAGPSIIFVDEPFSSAPEKYSDALLLANLEHLATQGHRIVVALHNHKAIEQIQEFADSGASTYEINVSSFRSHVGDNGDLKFTHKYEPGHAPSMALEVAKSLSGPLLKEILSAEIQK